MDRTLFHDCDGWLASLAARQNEFPHVVMGNADVVELDVVSCIFPSTSTRDCADYYHDGFGFSSPVYYPCQKI